MDRVLGAGLCAERVGGLGWVSSGRLGGGCWMRRRGEGPPQKKNKTFNQTSGESLVLFPTPATLFNFPFQLPFSGGKGKHPAQGRDVLACRRFCDSPNPSIGESSKEDEKARSSSFENFPDKSVTQGTGIEAPRSCPEV